MSARPTTLVARLGYEDKNADGTVCAHCGDRLGAHDYCPARQALRCSSTK